jgi:N utilization substance protein A
MAIGVSANKLEILQIARAVAQEKMIDESIVLEAIEEAIQKAARSRYGAELDIHCNINPKTGEMRLTSRTTVVEEVENDTHQLTLEQAASAIPKPRSALSTKKSCRRSSLAASPRRPPSR